MTLFFLKEKEAEKTASALRQVHDNLPDAVIMLEADSSVSYCN